MSHLWAIIVVIAIGKISETNIIDDASKEVSPYKQTLKERWILYDILLLAVEVLGHYL